jgi:phosphotransacetylase
MTFTPSGNVDKRAALASSVGTANVSSSVVARHSEVMIFSNSETGKIADKLAQRRGRASALEPL